VERFLNPALVVLLLLVAMMSLAIGTLDLEVSSALVNWISNQLTGEALTREALIVGEIRLPRTLLALIVGAAMGMSGAALQGLLRNPLVDPGLIGVSQGAALGAALVFYFNILPSLGTLATPIAGLRHLYLVECVARRRAELRTQSLRDAGACVLAAGLGIQSWS